ncbi:hypothetical protein K490DRAFT_61914 [Saccharata proteae CBS 121410]|uniref:Uncharacterized protein n=1 Tax=Saccharata proteae CBS 121410 TaxID=1314787 RepID=A0A9P4M269_9PEZI|nr:hypothetical protein K490DRAFT_61914 [Saccharata proteae CBS 121410]
MFGFIHDILARFLGGAAPSMEDDEDDVTDEIEDDYDYITDEYLDFKHAEILRLMLRQILGYSVSSENDLRHFTAKRIASIRAANHHSCPELVYCWSVLIRMRDVQGRTSDLVELLDLFRIPLDRHCPPTSNTVWETLASMLKSPAARLLCKPPNKVNNTTAKDLIEAWRKELEPIRDYEHEPPIWYGWEDHHSRKSRPVRWRDEDETVHTRDVDDDFVLVYYEENSDDD